MGDRFRDTSLGTTTRTCPRCSTSRWGVRLQQQLNAKCVLWVMVQWSPWIWSRPTRTLVGRHGTKSPQGTRMWVFFFFAYKSSSTCTLFGSKKKVETELHCKIVARLKRILTVAPFLQALHRVWAGEGSFGQKSVVDTAMLLTGAATENPAGFAPPTVSFAFVEGVPDCMAKDLVTRFLICIYCLNLFTCIRG